MAPTQTDKERSLRADAEQNRERIVEAARELFAERGIDVTMEEIAREAGVGVATLYRRYPTRAELGAALRSLRKHGIELDGAADHGVSEALYLHDQDGNGVELYWDRPEAEWPRDAQGGIAMVTKPLDLKGLLAAQ